MTHRTRPRTDGEETQVTEELWKLEPTTAELAMGDLLRDA